MNTCFLCGEEVSFLRAGNFREVTGLAEDRGSQGGTNALKNKVYSGRVAHRYCVLYANGQKSLFKEVQQEVFPLNEIQKERYA